MKLKHNTTTAFSIAGVTAMFVAAAVWATPQTPGPATFAAKPPADNAGSPIRHLSTQCPYKSGKPAAV
jgi:hypothetical protein